MKRLHVNVAVGDLERSIGFYSALFDAEPVVRKPDYAKWMLEDPRVNFAVSTRSGKRGLDHLGIQVDDRAELAEVYDRLKTAEGRMVEQGETTCCYARSEKSWISDPEGIAWETFLTLGETPVYGSDAELAASDRAKAACCLPAQVAPLAETETEAEAGSDAGAAPATAGSSCCK